MIIGGLYKYQWAPRAVYHYSYSYITHYKTDEEHYYMMDFYTDNKSPDSTTNPHKYDIITDIFAEGDL